VVGDARWFLSARLVTYAAKDKVKDGTAITGMMFEPLGELQPIPPSQDESFARQHFHPACEAALNDQINVRAPPDPSLNPPVSWEAKGCGLPCDSVTRPPGRDAAPDAASGSGER
jgi:hypothetical protein